MGPPIFPNITKDKISLGPGEKTCSFISWGGIILDLGGNFSKYIDRRRHLDTSHQGTWSGSALIYLLTRRLRKRIENRKPPKGLVKLLLCFFIISATVSSSWILHLLVLPLPLCWNFSCLIFWYFLDPCLTVKRGPMISPLSVCQYDSMSVGKRDFTKVAYRIFLKFLKKLGCLKGKKLTEKTHFENNNAPKYPENRFFFYFPKN